MPSLNIAIITKTIAACLLALWAFVAFLISRQTALLHRFLPTKFGRFLYFVTLLYTGSVVGILIWIIWNNLLT